MYLNSNSKSNCSLYLYILACVDYFASISVSFCHVDLLALILDTFQLTYRPLLSTHAIEIVNVDILNKNSFFNSKTIIYVLASFAAHQTTAHCFSLNFTCDSKWTELPGFNIFSSQACKWTTKPNI